MPSVHIESVRLIMRPMLAQDAHGPYLAWMSDPEVLKHLEARHAIHTAESLTRYIAEMSNRTDTLFLAIVEKSSGRHIGNIKLGLIDADQKRAEMGIMLGAKDVWGRGYGSEAIAALCDHAFRIIGLHRVQAGCYADNEGSRRAFIKAGFAQEGRLRDYWLIESGWQDQLILGRTSNERVRKHGA